MDPIKEAFSKIKEEISSLRLDIEQIYKSLLDLKLSNQALASSLSKDSNTKLLGPTSNSTPEALKSQNIGSSIGNRGVPTHQPTNTSTHQHTEKTPSLKELPETENSFKAINETLNSLGILQKEVIQKIKGLTSQEATVLSLFYTLDPTSLGLDHKTLAEALSLSESSIRDYVLRLIKKGIPIEKEKINNKALLLRLNPSFKELLSLESVLKIKEVSF